MGEFLFLFFKSSQFVNTLMSVWSLCFVGLHASLKALKSKSVDYDDND